MKKVLLAVGLVGSLMAVLTACPIARAQRVTPPNLLMIFTDDQRYDAVGYSGNLAIQTPHLDRLARRGTVFQNCFVNTSICAISRANLISGQYPSRHGIDDFFKTFRPDQLRQSVPALLQAAGYQTGLIGKWGIGDHPAATHEGAAVFEYWAAQPMQTCYFHEPNCRHVRANGFTRDPLDLCDCPPDADGKLGYRNRIGKANLKQPLHVDADVTPIHVQRFLEGRDPDRPFCLILMMKSPHSPYGDWAESAKHVTDDLNLSPPAAATLANAMREPPIVAQSLGRPAGMNLLKNDATRQAHQRDYYRSVTSLDTGVGRVVEQLGIAGVDDNTVVLFTSDNGHMIGEHGLSGKWLMYEPSLRVPGFVMDPRRPGGRVSTAMVITTDFSATMLALAGLEVPDSISGRDLTTLLDHPAAEWRDSFYYDHPYGHGGKIPRTVGVRTERYVYTRYVDPNPALEQLFDVRSDPNQLNDLADDPASEPVLRAMRRRCDELASEVGSRN